jgi:predicted RNA-binding Zn ribbon-like protein
MSGQPTAGPAAAPAGRQIQASAAPGDLEVVRAFVNTLDIEQGTDDLSTASGLGRWLGARRLAAAARPSAGDLSSALALREALRCVLRWHAGHPGSLAFDAGGRGASDLKAIAAVLPVRLGVDGRGAVTVLPAGPGVPGALARLLLIASAAAANGTWDRLKVCTADDCQWAFYDRSPTRNGRWCTMSICGSRAKSRAYRRRAQES